MKRTMKHNQSDGIIKALLAIPHSMDDPAPGGTQHELPAPDSLALVPATPPAPPDLPEEDMLEHDVPLGIWNPFFSKQKQIDSHVIP